MITIPVPTSCMVCPVEGSTSLTVFYSIFNPVLACVVSTILEASKVFLSTKMWPEIKVSRVSGEVEHPETLKYIYQCSVNKSVSNLHIACPCKYCYLLYLLRSGLRSKCPEFLDA